MKRRTQSLQVLIFTLIAAVAIMGYLPTGAVHAQAAATGDDLRATRATAQDVAEGKRVAEAACVRCHGVSGISTTKGVPHLAGQRPVYLHLELRAYISGARSDRVMDNAVKFLSDDALIKVAAYYASLDPPPPSSAKVGAAKPDPVQAGKAAAADCAGCHGETGISKIPGMPSLVGFDPKYFIAAMNAYKSGQRKHDMMKTLVAALSDADVKNIALYYALQKPARTQNPAPGDQAAGKVASAVCAGCHGELGVSGNPATPNLAGQDAQYFAVALRAYKEGSRSDEVMKGFAASLDDKTIKNLAAFYAAQQPQAPKVSKPLTLAEWTQRCDRCHGVNGNSTDPLSPALAGQRVDYLAKVLTAYRTGERKNTTMAAMASVLTEAEVESLALHYAQQKPRAVVYMPQPGK